MGAHVAVHKHSAGSLFSRFFPAPQFMAPLAGALDISESSVKFLSLTKKKGMHVPDVFVQVPLAPGIVKGGDILKPDDLTQVIKGIFVKHNVAEVYVSLPEEFAYIYPIAVGSSQSAEQIKTAVEFSMSEHVPLPQQQVVYDTVTMPQSGKSKYISVTAFDSAKSETYLQVVSRAGFVVRALETEVHAAVRSCVPENEEGVVL
ncbi:MAG: Type pilus assembly protein PilM, partial [Candidatus Parcubacteria bacterium]